MAKGADFSFDKPPAAVLAKYGFAFAVGYVGPGSTGKLLTEGERNSYLDTGLAMGYVAEGTGREPLSLSSLKSEVSSANSHMARLGVPDNVALFCANDFQPSSSQIVTISHNILAARQIVRRHVGLYGSYSLLKYCLDHNSIDYGWQTYAWSGGRRDTRAQVYQYSNNHKLSGGGTVDYNTIYHNGWYELRNLKYPGSELVESTKFNSDVRVLQVRLNLLSNAGLVGDGYFGSKTNTAVKTFQKARKITIDGVVGPQTWGQLQH